MSRRWLVVADRVRLAADEAGLLSKSLLSLFVSQGVPSMLTFVVSSLCVVTDAILVGQWVGPMGLAAISVCLPILPMVVG